MPAQALPDLLVGVLAFDPDLDLPASVKPYAVSTTAP